jgi:hypothetical protein
MERDREEVYKKQSCQGSPNEQGDREKPARGDDAAWGDTEKPGRGDPR